MSVKEEKSLSVPAKKKKINGVIERLKAQSAEYGQEGLQASVQSLVMKQAEDLLLS